MQQNAKDAPESRPGAFVGELVEYLNKAKGMGLITPVEQLPFPELHKDKTSYYFEPYIVEVVYHHAVGLGSGYYVLTVRVDMEGKPVVLNDYRWVADGPWQKDIPILTEHLKRSVHAQLHANHLREQERRRQEEASTAAAAIKWSERVKKCHGGFEMALDRLDSKSN